MTAELMRMTLAVAVPMWIDRCKLRPMGGLLECAAECGQYIAEHGDVAQFRGKKKGETAAAFNRLAEGLAILAFVPGGVTFLGDHWEAVHPDAQP